MKAITVLPGHAGSARLDDVDEPPLSDGPVLVQTWLVGICGTDTSMLAGEHGCAPPGSDRLIIGHESLGHVIQAPTSSGLAVDDLVVGIVRRPDPEPCPNCAAGEWDMCRNGRYTERGLKQRHGFASERFRLHPMYAIRVPSDLGHLGVLVEPISVVAKVWEQIEYIGARSHWQPQRVLVSGAGPIGLLAALLGVQRGLDVHVFDRVTSGPKPQLVADLGATYRSESIAEASRGVDVVIECTGVGQLVLDVIQRETAPNTIMALTGFSSGEPAVPIDAATMNRHMVLGNEVVFGSINANRRHYEAGLLALAKADRGWLDRLITRRVPLERWAAAFERQPGDIKTVIGFTVHAPS